MTAKKRQTLKPADHIVTAYTPIRDADLTTENIRLPDGRRLTDALANRLAAEGAEQAHKQGLIPGPKSLSGGATHSPVVQFRVPQSTKHALDEAAARLGVSPSKLGRQALDDYLERIAQ